MPVIAMVNQKGGVGKTCLATNLASALGRGHPTLLLDCDPQRSASGWIALAPQERLQLTVRAAGEGALVRQVRAAAAEYRWVVMDCPPGITRVNADAIRLSDLVLIPCKPRVWDVWACGHRGGGQGPPGREPGTAPGRLRHQHGPHPHPLQPADQYGTVRSGLAHPAGTHHREGGLRRGGRGGPLGARRPRPRGQGRDKRHLRRGNGAL